MTALDAPLVPLDGSPRLRLIDASLVRALDRRVIVATGYAADEDVPAGTQYQLDGVTAKTTTNLAAGLWVMGAGRDSYNLPAVVTLQVLP